jgi:SnoaL-like domain
MTKSVADIEARMAIAEVKARYCRMLDTKNWEGFADVFTEDIELDTRPSGGTLSRGRDEVMLTVRASIETAITAHQVHSPEITLDGDMAHVIWAMQDRVVFGAGHSFDPNITGLTGYGHYHERYVLQNGRWRIQASKLTRLHMDFSRDTPAVE